MNNNSIYKSKVDWWLFLMVAASCIALPVLAIYSIFTEGLSSSPSVILLACSVFIISIMYALAYPVTYQLTEADLIIRSGRRRIAIELSSIESIKLSRNPLSAPAWSLDRLRIDFRSKDRLTYVLISPEDRIAFLNELKLKTEGLSIREEKTVSLPG